MIDKVGYSNYWCKFLFHQPVGPHPEPELGSHRLISTDVDQVSKADVCHVEEGVVYAVQVGPVVLHQPEDSRGKQDEQADTRYGANECY